MTVGQILAEPLAVHGIVPERRGRARRACGPARAGRAPAAARRPLPAPAVGRPAPARRDRPRPRRGAVADRLRRAGVGARRLDPGADHQPARGSAGGVRADLPVHRPRPRGRPAHLRPGGGHVPGQDRRDRRPARRCTTTRCTPTRKALLSAVPIPDPVLEARAGADGARRARCRARSIRRPAACSIPAARSPSIAAGRRYPRCARSAPATGPPACWPDMRSGLDTMAHG